MGPDKTGNQSDTSSVDETPIPTIERRASLRLAASYPAKMYDRRAERYFAAETCNVSETGALLKVQRSMPVIAGDVFDLAVTQKAPSVVIGKKNLVPAIVVRVIPIDHYSQAVAVRYDRMPAVVSTPETDAVVVSGDERRAA